VPIINNNHKSDDLEERILRSGEVSPSWTGHGPVGLQTPQMDARILDKIAGKHRTYQGARSVRRILRYFLEDGNCLKKNI